MYKFKESKLINDTLYKHIECSQFENKILQTKILNRLFFVTQNALAYFAYPSINTKRYIHSLGTMHLSAHMYKNAILNAKSDTKNEYLKKLKKSIVNIIDQNNLSINLKKMDNFEDKTLFEFMIPLKSKSSHEVYLITLQALRIVGLLHDVGHLPFSHQVEYAIDKIYSNIKNKENKNKKELELINFYESITKNSKYVLHEAIGTKLIKLLFEHEMRQFSNSKEEDDYTKLIYILVRYILNEKDDGIFNYKVLHKFISSTVDADRLDYINRDMLASGYIGGSIDFIRITKKCVLLKEKKEFDVSFFDSQLIDIEHMLEMRFNQYKKITYSHKISVIDSLLEEVIVLLANRYLQSDTNHTNKLDSISMLWKFLDEQNLEKRLDTISQLDENWLITLFKKEYFDIKYKNTHTLTDKKNLLAFEEILFGKKYYNSIWKNLNDLYNILEFTDVEKYKFRESFGYVSKNNYKKLQSKLDKLCQKYENEENEQFLTYRLVSLKIGIEKDFSLYDGEELIHIDKISTVRKRLKKSILNTVPFYIFTNKENLSNELKQELKKLLYDIFL